MMYAARTCADSAGSMDHYLDSIRGDGLLTAAEERSLSEAIARGDRDARARMIRSNLRLVVRIARDYLGRGLPLDDLVGEGNLGLIRAAADFDPRFGTRFSTYAAHWIKQSIRHALLNTAPTIRLPAHMVGLLTRWRRAEKTLRRDLGHDPSDHQVADAMGLSPTQRGMVASALQSRRLHHEADTYGDDAPRDAGQALDLRQPPEAQVEEAEVRMDVHRRLDRLDPRERAVISLRFGLDGQPPQTLKSIGLRLGVTREWVRKIEQRAVRKLDDSPHLHAARMA